MIDNFDLLQNLLFNKLIALENAHFLTVIPDKLPEDWNYERVEGMLLGLAIGDALGNTTESLLPQERRSKYGEIREYLPNRYAEMRRVGLPSDDTQMAFWTLEQLIADDGLVPDRLATKFTKSNIFGIGRTVKDFLRTYKDMGQSWVSAGRRSAGNGALMRIAPVLIPYLQQPSQALWADAALAGMITHNDRASISCCIALTHILWECLLLKQVPESIWWVEKFTSVASQLEGDTSYAPRQSGIFYSGPLWKYTEREVRRATKEGWTSLEACERWHSGAYLLETMPCVLYILSRYAENPEEAIVRAVNDTKDNDTVAAIVGAIVGALHGRVGLPTRWISELLGRIDENDDWHIFELIEDAKQVFWQKDQQLSQSELNEILNFLPVFEQPDYKPGQWNSPEKAFPYYGYSSEVLAFLEVLYKYNFILPFDWTNWAEGKRLVEDPTLIQKSNMQTLRKLLTAHVRATDFQKAILQVFLRQAE